MKSILTLAYLGLCLPLCAQNPAVEERVVHSIRCECIIAHVSTSKALTLRKELKNSKTAVKAFEKLVQWLENGEAEIVDWPTVTTEPSNDFSFENTRAVRQPIQYELSRLEPSDPKDRKEQLPQPGLGPTAPTPENASPIVSASEDKLIPADGKPTTWAEAGQVEFRSVDVGVKIGGSVQFEIYWDGKNYRPIPEQIEARLFASHVSLLGYRQERFVMKGGLTGMVEQPRIETRDFHVNLKLKAGVPQMVGFFKLNEPKNTVEIWVLSATVVETNFKVPKTPPPPPVPVVNLPGTVFASELEETDSAPPVPENVPSESVLAPK